MKRFVFTMILVLLSITLMAQKSELTHIQALAGYESDFTSEPNGRSFTIYSVGLGYKGELTAIYGKFNLGNLSLQQPDGSYDNSSVNNKQFELDYYQSLNKKKSTTFWLNYAYSQDQVFPTHRVMFEAWQKLPLNFLVSAGGSYYKFPTDSAFILNAGLENYFGKFWLEFKTYFYLKEPDITTSYYLSGRLFIKDTDYFQVTVGMGSAEDEPFILPTDLDRLYGYTAKLRYCGKIGKRFEVRTGVSYMYEEYQPDLWRNRYAFGVGLIFNIN